MIGSPPEERCDADGKAASTVTRDACFSTRMALFTLQERSSRFILPFTGDCSFFDIRPGYLLTVNY